MAKVTLEGHVGNDPELAVARNGREYLRLRVAERKADSEATQWWTVLLWGTMARAHAEIVRKGMSVHVDGRLAIRRYTRQDGREEVDCTVHADALGVSTKDGEDARQGEGGQRRTTAEGRGMQSYRPQETSEGGQPLPEDDPFADE
jgi:single-strand DNA-binding protein